MARKKGQYTIGLSEFVNAYAPIGINLVANNKYDNFKIGRDFYIYQFENKVQLAEDFQPTFRIIINRRTNRVKLEWVGLNNNAWYKIRKQYSNIKNDLEQLFNEWSKVYKPEFDTIRIV